MADHTDRKNGDMGLYIVLTLAILAGSLIISFRDCLGEHEGNTPVEQAETEEGNAEELQDEPQEAQPAPPRRRSRDPGPAPNPTPRNGGNKPQSEEDLKSGGSAHPCPSTPIDPARMRYARDLMVARIKDRRQYHFETTEGTIEVPRGLRANLGVIDGERVLTFVIWLEYRRWTASINNGCVLERAHRDDLMDVRWTPHGEAVNLQYHAEAQAEYARHVDALIAHLERQSP